MNVCGGGHAIKGGDMAKKKTEEIKEAAQPTLPPVITFQGVDGRVCIFADGQHAASVDAGMSPETIKSNIRARAGEFIRDGIDVNELLQQVDTLYLQRLQAQPQAAQQNQVGWYTGLDQSLGGWLPRGAPRR